MAGVHFKVTGDANGYVAATRQAEAATKGMVSRVTDEAKKIDNIFKTLATSAGTLFTVQMATQFSKQVAQVRGEFQQLEVAFETMLQSKEKADALMAQVVDTAAKTPFDLQGVASGAKQLLAYGVASEEVNDTLIRLGDIAAGLSIPLNDLVYLYGTTMTQGRLFTQDLRQFQGRGIPLADELAKQFGVAKDAVGELVTAGKVGFPEVQKAIIAMTSEGGKFNNLMAKQSQTITGQISNLEDAVSQMFNEIGKASEGAISGAIGMASSLVENYEKVGRLIGGIVTAFGAYKAAVIALNAVDKARNAILAAQAVAQRAAAISAKQVTTATVLWTKAQKALNASMLANPYVLAAVAVAALGVGIYALVTAKTKEERIHERVNDQIERYNENLEKQKQQMQELFDTLNSPESTDMQRVLAMKQLRELYPSILKDLSDEELMKLSVAEATRKLTEENEKLLRSDLQSQILAASKGYDEAMQKISKYKNQQSDATVKSYQKNSGYIQALKDAEKYRFELEALLSQYNELEEAAKKAEFLALPADQKIVSLKQSNAELDEEIIELDKKLAELRKKKNQAKDGEPTEFALGSLSGALYEGGMTEDQILAKIKARQQQKALNDKDIAENQAKVDADNKALSDKQKKANYERIKAETKAKEELAKMKRDLNNKVAQADIDSMEDGYDKTIRQLKHNLNLENETIAQQKEDLKKKKYNDALQSWLAEDPENNKAWDFKYTATLTPEELAMFEEMGILAQQQFDKGREEAREKWEKEAGFFQRQMQIDSMSEGKDKDLAQRQLDNEKELHALESQRDAYIEAAKSAHILAEERKAASDPDYKMQDFDESRANADFDKIVKDTENRQKGSGAQREADAWNEYLLAYGNYQEKKLAIEEKYKKLIANAGTAGEVATYEKQQEQELFDLEVAYGKTANTIASLFGDMRKKSADDLNEIANEGEKALEFIKSGNYTSDNAFGISKEQFELIKNSPEELDKIEKAILGIREQADSLEAPTVKIVEGFKELFASKEGTEAFEKALAKIQNGVTDITDAVGYLSSSMRSMGKALGNDVMQNAADDIDSALNVVGETMSGAQAGAAFGPWGAAIGAALGLATSLVTEISKAKDAVHQVEIDRLADENENLDKSYRELGKSIEDAFSVDASDLIKQQNTLLEQKKENLRLMISEEEQKKGADQKQIDQWKAEIDGIETQIEDNAEKAKEAILGISFDGFRDNFLDALLDMEEGAEDFADNIEEDIRKAMYEALLTDDAFENQLQSFYDDLATAIEAGDTREIDRLKAAILNLYDSQAEKAKEIDEKLGYEASSNRSASEKGVAQASQSSVEELNGRMTAVQSHTFSINERVGSLLNVANQTLARVISIEGHTARLETIETNIANMSDYLFDILTRGINVR